MKQLFTSATIKLTVWYLGIIMAISILFSIVLYQVSLNELDTRLDFFQTRLEHDATESLSPELNTIRDRQLRETRLTLFAALFYLNLVILVVGGLGSYILARRSLKPIEESHEAQARFASDASHELRTPLAVMKSELEVALRDPKLPKAEMRELLESNLEEVDRLSGLSKVLLQLSRQDISQLDMKRLDLVELLGVSTRIRSLDHGRIRYTMPSKKVYINGNNESVIELIMILLDNALRYSPVESPVDLSVETKRDSVMVQIRNKGKGIAEEDLPHIFERFYRADKSRTSGTESGYGLGLSLAKTLADLHGASITISSKQNEYTQAVVTFKKAKKA